jgi:hypothetical protein
VAIIVAACACWNCRHVVSASRFGTGGIFSALRTRRIVDALTLWPSLSSSPWIRWYPGRDFRGELLDQRSAGDPGLPRRARRDLVGRRRDPGLVGPGGSTRPVVC